MTGIPLRTLALHTHDWVCRTTHRTAPRRWAGLGALALLLLSAGGCGDMVMQAPGDTRARGIQLYNEGNFADAAGAFGTATRQDPRDYQSYYYLGRSYESLKSYHQAIGAYRTALDVMKNHLKGSEDADFRVKVLDHLASAIAQSNDPEVEASLRQRAGGPAGPGTGSIEDKLVLAKVMQHHGDIDNAIEAYTQAALSESENAVVAKEFGLFLVQINQPQRAAGQLKKAWVLNRRAKKPEDPQVVAALRQIGIVPGPSLLEEKDLVQPDIPRGPLPEWDVSKIGFQQEGAAQPDGAKPAAPAPQGGGPRD